MSILKEVHLLKDEDDRPGWMYIFKLSVDGKTGYLVGFSTSPDRVYINELIFAYPDAVLVFDIFVDSIAVFYVVKHKLQDFCHLDLTLYHVYKDIDLAMIKMTVIHEANCYVIEHSPEL